MPKAGPTGTNLVTNTNPASVVPTVVNPAAPAIRTVINPPSLPVPTVINASASVAAPPDNKSAPTVASHIPKKRTLHRGSEFACCTRCEEDKKTCVVDFNDNTKGCNRCQEMKKGCSLRRVIYSRRKNAKQIEARNTAEYDAPDLDENRKRCKIYQNKFPPCTKCKLRRILLEERL